MNKVSEQTLAARQAAALILFRQQPDLTTREVARRTGLSKSTAHRLRHRAQLSGGQHVDPSLAAGPVVTSSPWIVLPTGQVVLSPSAASHG